MTNQCKESLRIGVDLGGTKIEGLAIAPDGAELARRRVATPREDYDETLYTIHEIVRLWFVTRALTKPHLP